MTDRSVVVRLRAEVDGLKRGMAEATKSVKGVGDEAEKSGKRASTASERMIQSATKNKDAWEKSGRALIVTGAALAAGVGIAVKTFADFDAQMSQVKTLSHATSAEMAQLTNAALTMGQAIGFSASQTAEAETELVKAGVSVKDIMGGALVGALNLAAAGQIEVGRATEIASVAMTQFALKGKDVPHIADLLAAGADKSLGGVEELGQALQQGGLVASQFGLTIDETVGTLSEFAAAGLLGSDAGTSMKQMFLSLASPSQKARDEMDKFGISAYDLQGNFIGVNGLAGQLHDSFKGVDAASRDAALSIIFGSDAVRAANVLMKDGAAGNQRWTDSVNDTGFAADQAAGKMDNFKGDLAKLKAAFENDLIKSGSVANGTLRTMTQAVTDVAKGYGDLPRPVQGAVLALGGVAGVASLAAGGFLLLLPRALETVKAFRALKADMPGLVSNMSRAAKVAGGVAGYVALAAAAEQLYESMGPASMSVNEMVSSLLDLNDVGLEKINQGFAGIQRGAGLITSYNVNNLADAARKLADPGLLDRLNDFGGEMLSFGGSQGSSERTKLIEQVNSIGDALGQLVSSGHADIAASRFKDLSDQWVAGGGSLKTFRELMPGYRDALAAADNEQALAADSAVGAAGGIDNVGSAAKDAAKTVDDLDSALKALFDATYSVQAATDDYFTSLNDLSKAVKDNGKSLKGNSDAALDNRSKLRDVAGAADDVISKMVAQGASYDEVVAKTKTLKSAYHEHAKSAGITGQAVKDVDTYLDRLPGTYKAIIDAQDNASGPAHNAKNALDRIPGNYQATITTRFRTIGQPTPYTKGGGGGAGIVVTQSGSGVVRKADGGTVVGQGGTRQDNVPALLSPGEEVIKASEASKHRGLLKAINAGTFADGGTVGRYFDAGGVSARPARAASSEGRPVEVNVYPSAGKDERAIARNVAAELVWGMR